MNKEEMKVMIKDCVYSEDGITYMSDKQYNNYINIIEQLQRENQELKAKIKTYEDPEDLTLMFMYCDEKAKDKIKELKEVIDKAIEYIEIHKRKDEFLELNQWGTRDLLEILKGENNE